MNTGLGDLFLCIKSRELRQPPGAALRFPAPGVMLRPLVVPHRQN